MQPGSRQPFILMLEDDNEDRYITESYFREKGHNVRLEFLTHGPEVMQYLQQCEKDESGYPQLILLDKNVPTGSGMDVLKELKSHPRFRSLPVVMISGSAFPNEIAECYMLGANSYIHKPSTNKLTIQKIESFFNYWFDTVELPDVLENVKPNLFQ